MFKGILIEKDEAGYRSTAQELDPAQLPEGDVTVDVLYSTLNYKDGLAITGKGPIVRKFPFVPGDRSGRHGTRKQLATVESWRQSGA